jgi:hypothetical protein
MCSEVIENCQLALEDISECVLRYLPKLVSKILMQVRQNESLKLTPLPFSDTYLESFGEKVSELPIGITLELWKTFLHHMEKDVVEIGHVDVAKNMALMLEVLFSTFLENACVVDQVFFLPAKKEFKDNFIDYEVDLGHSTKDHGQDHSTDQRNPKKHIEHQSKRNKSSN